MSSPYKLIETYLYQDVRSGVYYFRANTSQGGRRAQVVKSLRTTVKRVAQERIRTHVKAWLSRISTAGALLNGAVSMPELVRLYLQDAAGNKLLTEKAKADRGVAIQRMVRSWPEFYQLKPSEVTNLMVRDWASKVLPTIERKPPPGSRQPPRRLSPATANKCIDALSTLFQFAITQGLLTENPVHNIPRQKVARTKLNLPTRQQFEQVLEIMRFAHRAGPIKAFLALTDEEKAWRQKMLCDRLDISAATLTRYRKLHREGKLAASGNGADEADLALGMASTGIRISEANALTWRMLDLDGGLIDVPGTKTESSARIVPMTPEAKALFLRMRAERKDEPSDTPVFRVKDCSRTLTYACAKVGVTRLKHHSLRHLFATSAVKAQVDMPSVAALLGHKDRGVLAMKTYAHVDNVHLRSMAQKIGIVGERSR